MPRNHNVLTLYPKNKSQRLDARVFANPPAEYRGAPFWCWNDRIDIKQLIRQIGYLQEMGFGGFNIHSRTGLASEYLGKEFMSAVKKCTAQAKRRKMKAWLYDEDRWPSGYAGGLVTQDEKFRMRHLLWTCVPYGQAGTPTPPRGTVQIGRFENGVLIGAYEVELKDGYLQSYKKISEGSEYHGAPARAQKVFDHGPEPRDTDEGSSTRIWYAYMEVAKPDPWFNQQTYVDVMNPHAIERFIQTTHAQYKKVIGREFGKTVPAIFADEPQFAKKSVFAKSNDTNDLFMPWTPALLESYRKRFNENLEDHLPELFWDLPGGKASVTRYRYHEHTAELFASSFGDVLGNWCEKNKIALTGHMLGEGNLFGQSRGNGESMRALRSFHIPGIDILSDKREYTTAKQAQSIAHQFGRPGVLSELYGVTNWDYTFAGHKAQGDWQAAMGVSVRVPHLCWVSMAGEAKRDYPASIFYQSPWFKEYGLIEDHFARVNAVMTRGKPVARIGVIHPIESMWLHVGPGETSEFQIKKHEEEFANLTKWLLFGNVDFDYLSEGTLEQLKTRAAGSQLCVGEMKYDAIIVPDLHTIRGFTLKRLREFHDKGGKVIFAGDVPDLVDAISSDDPAKLSRDCTHVEFEKQEILDSVAEFCDIPVKHADGSAGDSIMHQLRRDGKSLQLFLVNTDRTLPRDTQISINGRWKVINRNTSTGKSSPFHAMVEKDRTQIHHHFVPAGHLLLTLEPATKTGHEHPARGLMHGRDAHARVALSKSSVAVTLSEPNVLLLDQPEWRINDGKWMPREEILKLENLARAELKLPARGGRCVQPWADREPAPARGQLQLRFAIHSQINVEDVSIAIENAADWTICLNGKQVKSKITGWWVDECIKTVRLGKLRKGKNELLLSIAMTRKTNVEWCYLLGDFGVKLTGRDSQLTAPIRTLKFGHWTSQGLPFYAGNVTYHCSSPITAGNAALDIPEFKAPLLKVEVGGKRRGVIAFPPFQLPLGKVRKGDKIDITAFGNRHNAFGALHNTVENNMWIGPGAWRTSGDKWTYEYRLKPTGILSAPSLSDLK